MGADATIAIMKKDGEPPSSIIYHGTKYILNSDESMELYGLTWDTYVPEDESKDVILERVRQTGRIVRTKG